MARRMRQIHPLARHMRKHGANSEPLIPLPPSNQPLTFKRLLLLAGLLPLVIAATDYFLLHRIAAPGADLHYYRSAGRADICLQFVWYVVQIGIVGYLVARGIADRFWRWLVFGWILTLVTILAVIGAFSTGLHPGTTLPAAGLFAGASGFCIAWAFFGDGQWQLRWPGMVLVSASIYSLWAGLAFHDYVHELWVELLLLHIIILMVFCALFRLGGFQLVNINSEAAVSDAESSNRAGLQFSLGHMLIWATALALVLGVAKSCDVFASNPTMTLHRAGLIWKLSLAASSGLSVVVALWVALGREAWYVRYPVGVFIAGLLGSAIGRWSTHNFSWYEQNWWRLQSRLGSTIDGQLMESYEIGWWWLGWIFLSGGLLAAMLIHVRTLGYRLSMIGEES